MKTEIWCLALVVFLTNVSATSHASSPRKPNVIIIFCDDLGYGDLSCYGHPTIRTPHLDRMAAEGMRLTQFYSASSVCTPSRAALLTGRLPIRSGMCGDQRRVLYTKAEGGLPDSEITLAEVLQSAGYDTKCIGKWHLGHHPQYLPPQHGFDAFFGVPYSNDMNPFYLIRGQETIEDDIDQRTLTQRYTEAAVEFIRQSRQQPFFLYLAHSFPHTPLFASDKFRGKSPRGLYGDVVEELDWSVGQVLDALRDVDLAENTFVFFTSDNGPWLIRRQNGGSAGLLREGKGSTFDGGMREPAIAWWPGKIPAGAIAHDLASTMDLFATCSGLAEVPLPDDRTLDSHDLRPVLLGTGRSTRDSLCYYRGTYLMAVRMGPWKAHFKTQPAYGPSRGHITEHNPPLLFHLEHDPGEQYDVSKKNPAVIAQINKLRAEHQAGLEPPMSQLDR